MQKANWVFADPFDDPIGDPFDDPFDDPFAVPSADPFLVVALSVDPMSVVSVRLLMAVHPHEDGQGVQSIASDNSARNQGKSF